MEIALKQQSEELCRSRSDYSALFQNFKQSRIIFEERELASKANLQRTQNENKVLEEALKELTGELKLCRSEFTELLKNFDQSSITSEQRDEASRVQLQRISDENETSKRKLREQKSAIKDQKAIQKGFQKDLEKFEHSTRLFELRENTLSEKYDHVVTLNCDLTEEMRQKADVITKQSAEIKRLNLIIADEMVSKYDFNCVLSEKENLMRAIDDDMISMQTHHHLKERYADLQLKLVGSMVSVDEYDNLVFKLEAMKVKAEAEYVPHTVHAVLQENFQKVVDEKYAVIETVKILQDAKINILRALQESEDRYNSLHTHLEGVEMELKACQTKEELRCEMAAIEDDRKKNMDRTLSAQRNILAIDSVRKERQASEQLEESMRNMESEFVKLNQQAVDELKQVKQKHAADVIKSEKMHRMALEELKCQCDVTVNQLSSEHMEEMNVLHDRHKRQLSSLAAESEEGRAAAEEVFKNKLAINNSAHEISEATLLKKHIADIESIKSAVISDSQRSLLGALEDQRKAFNEELGPLQAQLLKSREDLKTEKNRADICSADLLRIESEYKVALASVEEAYNHEVMKRENVNADNYRWQMHAQLNEKKITDHEEKLKTLTSEKKKNDEEYLRLREVALTFEMDSKNLRSQLEDVKDAVLESMSATLARTNIPPSHTSTSSLEIIKSTHTSDIPMNTITVRDSNPNPNSVKSHMRSTKNTAKNVRSKCTGEDPRNFQISQSTPIQAAISRKYALAANFSSTAAPKPQRKEQEKEQRQKEQEKEHLPSQRVNKTRRKTSEESGDFLRLEGLPSNGHSVKGLALSSAHTHTYRPDASRMVSPPRYLSREGEGRSSTERGQMGHGAVRAPGSTYTLGMEGPGSLSASVYVSDSPTAWSERDGGRDRNEDSSILRETHTQSSSAVGGWTGTGTGVPGTGYALYSPITPASTGRTGLVPTPLLALTPSSDLQYAPSGPLIRAGVYPSVIPPTTHSSSLELMDRLIHSARIRSPLRARNILSKST